MFSDKYPPANTPSHIFIGSSHSEFLLNAENSMQAIMTEVQ